MLRVEFDGELLAVSQRSYNDKVYHVAQLFVGDSPDSISIDDTYANLERGSYHFVATYNSVRKFMRITEVTANGKKA